MPSEEKERIVQALSAQNTRILGVMSAVSILLLLFWYACAFLMGHDLWTKHQSRVAMMFSALLIFPIGLIAAIRMDKNNKRIVELGED